MSDTLTLLMDAAEYLGPVGPIHPDTNAWKRPLPRGVSIDPAQLQAWERSGQHQAYAVRTGTKAAAWDIEVEYRAQVRPILDSFRGPWARSARGGVHLWTLPVERSASNLYHCGRHIGELKTNGAACTIPPSVKPKGPYTWERGPWRVPLWPPDDAMLALLPPEQPPAPVVPVRTTDEALDKLERLAQTLAKAGEGERNRVLYWAAMRACEAGISPFVAADVFVRAGADAGLPAVEVRRTVASAARKVGAV